MRLLIEFDGYAEEVSLIGKMLVSYGEFEWELAKLIGHSFAGDNNKAARIFWRVQGESARIEVADAILRPFFETLSLAGKWSNALGALRYCKNIRNQYAHCNWSSYLDKPGSLHFLNLEKDVPHPDGDVILQLYPTDLTLLKKQYQFFEHTNAWLWFLTCACRKAAGEPDTPDVEAPKSIPQPQKHNPRS